MRTRSLRSVVALFVVALAVPAMAQDQQQQDDQQQQQDQQTVAVDQFEPYGTVETTYEAYDVADRGALILTHTTPSDQQANFDVVGPDDYWNHFDFADEPTEEAVIEDLRPGVYSVAATDEGLSLVHTVVEVRAGETARVDVQLQAWQEGQFAPGTLDPYTTYGVRDRGAYPGYPGYPYGAYTMGEPTPFTDQAGFGAISVDARDDTIDTVVTGPNGYSIELEGDGITDPLWPGVYAVASTEQGFDTAVTSVEVQEGSQLEVSLSGVQMGAGGEGGQAEGGAQQDGQQQDGQQQDGEAQQNEDGAQAAAGATVATQQSEEFGAYLVDGDGRTLYMFETTGAEHTGPERMTEGVREAAASCSSSCLQAWPAFTSEGGEVQAGENVDSEMLYTAEFEGRMHVVYNGWPLYYFANDAEQGQIQGHGIESFGGTWYAMTPGGGEASSGSGEGGGESGN